MKALRIPILLCLLTATLSLSAQVTDGLSAQAFSEIREHPHLSANNYLAYPAPRQTRLDPPPAGYEPIYVSHYGRHGSRYFIQPDDYLFALQTLQRADSLRLLTPLGQQTLRQIRLMHAEADRRLGELTPLGARQHREIARRMFERFPEVFRDTAHIDARSTVVIRCILSMENALQEFIRLNPRLRISHDASQYDMPYMNQQDTILFRQKMNPASERLFQAMQDSLCQPERLMQSLFSSRRYWKKNIDSQILYTHLYHLAAVVQNSEIRHQLSLYPLFTADELCRLWETENLWWYLAYGPNPHNGGLQPYTQRNLLRNIIHEADSCLALGQPCATLRFGHETMVMPLACLLDLDGYGTPIDRPADVARRGWVDYRIFPMAANIQIVFFRQPDHPEAPTLVQVLLNENPATLPLQPHEGHYYLWSDFRRHYLQKLDEFDRQHTH